jgi:hypothetical protein
MRFILNSKIKNSNIIASITARDGSDRIFPGFFELGLLKRVIGRARAFKIQYMEDVIAVT